MVIDDTANLDRLPGHPVMQRWWSQMKDIMESYPDHSPVTTSLAEVFYMP
jgi:L-rhamnose mutarotase